MPEDPLYPGETGVKASIDILGIHRKHSPTGPDQIPPVKQSILVYA